MRLVTLGFGTGGSPSSLVLLGLSGAVFHDLAGVVDPRYVATADRGYFTAAAAGRDFTAHALRGPFVATAKGRVFNG